MRWWQGVGRCGRQGEGRGGPVTEWAIDEVSSRMEGGVIQAYVVRVKIESESWVFISAYGPVWHSATCHLMSPHYVQAISAP